MSESQELAFIFLIVGLGLVLVVLVTVFIIFYSWQRKKSRKVHVNKITSPGVFDIESVGKSDKLGSFIDTTSFGSPIKSMNTTTTNESISPRNSKSPRQSTPIKSHRISPNDFSEGTILQNGALCSVIVVPGDTVSPLTPSPTPTPEPKPDLSIINFSTPPAESKLSTKADHSDQKPPRHPRPRLSTLSMNKKPERMEKLPESENERLYTEYEEITKKHVTYTSSISQLQPHMRKNRYYDILPYDYNRVVIKNRPNDYINASYIKDDYGRIKYIAAQGPIGELETSGGRRDSTVEDFWHMIWQEKVDCVVCLTQCTENLRQKCAMYWPEYADESVKIDEDLSMNLYCYTEDENCFQREIWLEKKGEGTRKVMQWHFKEWKDATVPTEADTLLEFLEKTRQNNRKSPIVVHCSAGVGRTGVYIGLDMLLDCLENETVIDVAGTVAKLRSQRPNMVQNGEQYIALYEVIALAIRKKTRGTG